MNSLVGTTLDGYRILEIIRRGGMGVVYRARDTLLDRIVALKLLDEQLSDDPGVLKRFHREAQILARLEHPHIVHVYALRKTSRGLCIVMEYIEGETLKELLRRHPRLSLTQVRRLFFPLLEAMEYAHSMDVIHRDLHPGNVLVGKEHPVKVTDFGLARLLRSDNSTSLGRVVGTLHYMPPEQVRGLHRVDHRGDIYALGMMLYEMLTGQLPFAGHSGEYQLLCAILEEPIPPPHEVCPEIPPSLSSLVMRALEKVPSRRYGAVVEFRRALEAWMKREQIPPVVSESGAPHATDEESTVAFSEAQSRGADGENTAFPKEEATGTHSPEETGPEMKTPEFEGISGTIGISGKDAAPEEPFSGRETGVAAKKGRTDSGRLASRHSPPVSQPDSGEEEPVPELLREHLEKRRAQHRTGGKLPRGAAILIVALGALAGFWAVQWNLFHRVTSSVDRQADSLIRVPVAKEPGIVPQGRGVVSEDSAAAFSPNASLPDSGAQVRIPKKSSSSPEASASSRLRSLQPPALIGRDRPTSPARSGTVVVHTDPGVRVQIGEEVDQEVAEGSLRIGVRPGQYRVHLEHPRYGQKELRLLLSAGESRTLRWYFAADVNIQSLNEIGEPLWATIFINGKNTGLVTPYAHLTLGPGRHRITVRRTGYETLTPDKIVTVAPGHKKTVISAVFRLRKRPSR
ncbi:MAG: serine/threonine protein kinase [Calditrichaeota bacterium]|nr:MAG: serine/threonine protein kinase [Calditrichota bacterium]